MPKDRERYRYIDVGLERGSWTLAMFEEDARWHQMSDQPGKLITLRLTEYYEMKKEREVISSMHHCVLRYCGGYLCGSVIQYLSSLLSCSLAQLHEIGSTRKHKSSYEHI